MSHLPVTCVPQRDAVCALMQTLRLHPALMPTRTHTFALALTHHTTLSFSRCSTSPHARSSLWWHRPVFVGSPAARRYGPSLFSTRIFASSEPQPYRQPNPNLFHFRSRHRWRQFELAQQLSVANSPPSDHLPSHPTCAPHSLSSLPVVGQRCSFVLVSGVRVWPVSTGAVGPCGTRADQNRHAPAPSPVEQYYHCIGATLTISTFVSARLYIYIYIYVCVCVCVCVCILPFTRRLSVS